MVDAEIVNRCGKNITIQRKMENMEVENGRINKSTGS